MKPALVIGLTLALLLAPLDVYAQHGRGGGGWGGGGSGGGGWRGNGGGGGGTNGGGWRGGGGAGGGSQPRGNAAPGAGAGRPGGTGPQHGNPALANHVANHMNFSNRPNYHGNWYHGDWHGNWAHPGGFRPYGWGWGGWGGYGYGYGYGGLGWGFGLGVATVGVGMALASPWSWGYYSYYNPYWSAPYGGVTYINYSQPIVVQSPQYPPQQYPAQQNPQQQAPPQQAPPAQNIGVSGQTYTTGQPYSGNPYAAAGAPPAVNAAQQAKQDEGLAIFENARSLFSRGDYKNALAQVNRAIAVLPNDSVMHEFRALCLFAIGDYQQSAAAIYAVVSAGPGWDWTTVSNLYPDVNVYAGQLQALETYRSQHPDAAAPRFLLAYHYLLLGHNDQASAEFAQVVKLQPKDTLSAQLLKGLTTPALEPPTPGPAEDAAPPEAIDPASVVGDWRASRPDGSDFEMKLMGDKKFSWKFAQQDKKQTMTGTYTLADNYLILHAGEQNALVAQVQLEADNKLKFKLASGNPAEPGLTFTR
jgi:tetratricopeptide (TPR) repeat protein